VNDVSFSQDGELIVSASGDSTACVWDTCTGQQMFTLEGHTREVFVAKFSSDRKHVITRSSDRTVRTWDASTGVQMLSLKGYSATFSPDGKMIASAADANVYLCDGSTGQEIQVLRSTLDIYSVTFSQDGALVASGHGEGTVLVWEISGGQPILRFTGHSDIVQSVSFSQDDRLIVSGSDDCTARLWDVTTGECLNTSTKFSNKVNSTKFHSTNPCIIQLQVDGEIRYWIPSLPALPPFSDNSDSNSLSTPPNRHTLYPLYSVENRLIMATWAPAQNPVPIGWLPPTFKASKSDLCGSTMVIGGHGGEVLILRLPRSRTHS